METFFSKFPLTLYSNTLCRNLSRRIKFSRESLDQISLYYLYDIEDGKRADIIAHGYYEDSFKDWLIWLSNEIVDPYTQWNLSTEEFNNYLIKKYGTIANAQSHVVFYRNNWYEDDNVLTPSVYNNTIDQEWKKYYAPVYGEGTEVLFYRRREEDWTMATNKIYKFGIANNQEMIVGDLIDVYADGVRIGGGEINSLEGNTFVYVKHVDLIEPGFANSQIFVHETGNTSVANVALSYEAITNSEAVFWSQVTFYDIEEERNVYNQAIRILDRGYLLDTVEQIKARLNE